LVSVTRKCYFNIKHNMTKYYNYATTLQEKVKKQFLRTAATGEWEKSYK